MPAAAIPLPRLRQAVVAAKELEPTVARLQDELGLGEPYNDPAVGFFGLRNAVFALGDSFLEVVSPVRPDTAAGRLMQRRGGDCGYMVMFQVDDLPAARARVDSAGVREVFEVDARGHLRGSSAPARHARRDRLAESAAPAGVVALGRPGLAVAAPQPGGSSERRSPSPSPTTSGGDGER